MSSPYPSPADGPRLPPVQHPSRGQRARRWVHHHLAERGVNVSVSLVDYARLDLENRGLPDLVRASVHYYNTDEELDKLIKSLPARE